MAGIFLGLGVVLALLALPWTVDLELLAFGGVLGVGLHRKAAAWLAARNFTPPRPASLILGLAAIPLPLVGVVATVSSGVLLIAVIAAGIFAFSGPTV